MLVDEASSEGTTPVSSGSDEEMNNSKHPRVSSDVIRKYRERVRHMAERKKGYRPVLSFQCPGILWPRCRSWIPGA
eukprot:2587740-Lingulodinium_polyedra.AAC.1